FNMTLQNETRLPLTQNGILTPNVDLQLYGDGRNIVVAVGKGANLPRLFFGLCEKPCGFTLRDRNNYSIFEEERISSSPRLFPVFIACGQSSNSRTAHS